MTPQLARTRVIKVGGSLLNRSDLATLVKTEMENSSFDRNVLVVGGGTLVDCVREWNNTHGLTEQFCHQASVRLMSETARLLQQLLPCLALADSIERLPADEDCILDCAGLVLTQQNDLQPTWGTTSDSIAAFVANRLDASELWLAKSCLPESPRVSDWVANGYVDSLFADCIGQYPVYAWAPSTIDSLSSNTIQARLDDPQ